MKCEVKCEQCEECEDSNKYIYNRHLLENICLRHFISTIRVLVLIRDVSDTVIGNNKITNNNNLLYD